jgi:photosystem II stability/assembly factor-like uncharacterized protein
MKTFLIICVASLVILFNPSNAQWEELGPINGLPNIGSTSYFGIAIDGENIVAHEIDKMYLSTDNGDNWELTNFKPGVTPGGIYIWGVKDSNIFVTVGNDYQVSHDLGKTWKIFNDTSHPVSGPILFNGDIGIMGGCCSLNKTTDLGETFIRVLGNGWDNVGFSPVLFKNGYFFAGVGISGGHYRSTDNGDTWDGFLPPKIPSNGQYGSYGFFLSIKNLIISFDGSYDSAILSTDNGDTWVVKENYPKIIRRFHDIISCGNNLYGIGGVTEGVFISRDTGQTWSSFNKGLRLDGDYQGMKLSHDDKYLYAAYLGNGGGGGLYRAKMDDCEIDFSSDVAEQHEAENVNIYPNPVSDFLYLPKNSSNERIKIYSTIGICVSDFDPCEKVDVSSLSPGMYFVQLGDQIQKFVKVF